MTMTKKIGSQSEKAAVWTEVASVSIKRGINKDGYAPLILTQQIGNGALQNGRRFDVSLSLHDGSLIVYIAPVEGDGGDKSRVYLINPRDMVDAIVAAEFPELKE